MLTILSRYWWTFLLRGILAVLFGLAAFFWPAITLTALVLLFGAFAFADGFLTLVAAIRGRDALDRWWLYLLGGLAGIAAGILTFFWPGMTAIALLMFIAAWAIVTGVLEIAAAIRLRKEIVGEWALALAGVLSVLFGVILVMRPGAGVLAVVWLIGIYAVAFGIAMIVLAFRLRGLSKELASAPA
ncbi:MAG: HdeD family acid-resistance protein [Vicinamibacteria bacterium]